MKKSLLTSIFAIAVMFTIVLIPKAYASRNSTKSVESVNSVETEVIEESSTFTETEIKDPVEACISTIQAEAQLTIKLYDKDGNGIVWPDELEGTGKKLKLITIDNFTYGIAVDENSNSVDEYSVKTIEFK